MIAEGHRSGARGFVLLIACCSIVCCGKARDSVDSPVAGTTSSPTTAGGSGGAGAGAGAGAGNGSSAGTAGANTVAGGGGSAQAGSSAGSGGATAGSGGVGGATSGGGPGDGGVMTDDAGAAPLGGFPLADPSKAGPYMAVTKTATGPNGAYTLYHPAQLGPDGLKHPILTWGNGATTIPSLYSLLPHLATHGFVVIAADNSFVTGAELKAGIDWLIAEHARMGSELYDKLDVEQVASFGYSLGSLGTFEIAADPRLKTTVHISGGAMDKAVVPNLRNPAAFFCGDPSDIAHANCESDFELAKVPVFYGVFPGDHFGILAAFAEPINTATTAWLRWRLMGDQSQEKTFVGPDCTMCKDSGWTVKQRDFAVAP
jgi:hypothetical protein